MRSILPVLSFLCLASAASAQYGGPRLFLDIPNIYLAAPDVERVGNLLGAGAETAFNVGSHWSVARLGGGAIFSLDPKSEDVGGSFNTAPYVFVEAGLGKYRSNGRKCAKTHQSAFTLLGKGGVRYDFDAQKIDYTVGAEFGYFFIRDIFKNYEIFLNANYLTQAQTISAGFGFKLFLNLRANRD